MHRYIIYTIGVLLIILSALLAVYFLFTPKTSSSSPEALSLAACLVEKDAIMYGAEWCPHCQNEKRAFGTEAFARVRYVECPANKEVCMAAGVNAYPTWIIGGVLRLEGEQGLENLSRATGCPLTKNTSPAVQ